VHFDQNIVYNWAGTGRGAELASYQTAIIRNITLTNNHVQDLFDSTYLLALSSTTSDVLSEVHGSNNRWYRATGNANQMFQANGVAMSFSAFVSSIGDSTSTFGPFTYLDPNRTIATYQVTIGGVATLDAFMAQARQQSRSNWRIQYTANAVNSYIRAGFGL
jgi:hypothetical protein